MRGVPLDVVTLPSEHGADVLVSSVDAPSLAREGQEIALSAAIRSSFATSGKLQVFVDGDQEPNPAERAAIHQLFSTAREQVASRGLRGEGVNP